jgi:putative ABC transport system permease protein
MLHHIKFAIRIFLKDKFFSILNILGLALGIAVSVILLLILQNDLSYDKYHVKHKQIYRLGGHLYATGIDLQQARSARELGRILKEEFPEVEDMVEANNWSRRMVEIKEADGKEKQWYEDRIVRTDSNYFQMFTHRFIEGDPKTCLVDVNTVVLTRSTAQKFFGDESALDKQISIDGELHKVTGVIEDVPENTHLKFDILVSQLPAQRDWTKEGGGVKSEAFWNPDVFLYLQFPVGYDTRQFYEKFPTAIFDKYFKSFGDQVGGHYDPILENLADIHFHSKLSSDMPQGNLVYLYAFTAIGIFIIMLACINYMNLSTARSVNRAGEIAMKKTLGSSKRALVVSFLGESVLLSLIAMFLAVLIVLLVINATSFNSLIDKNLSTDFLNNKVLLFGTLGLTLFIGVLSGLYPALYLPSIPTLNALKGAFKNRKSSLYLRKSLTTIQFGISIFVVVCTLLMQDQIGFVRSRDLGFDKENMLLIPVQDTAVQNHINSIRAVFAQNPKILGSTVSYSVPGFNINGGAVMMAESDQGMTQQSFAIVAVGDDYLKTMGIELIDGRDFQAGDLDADKGFIVNEAAAKKMGWNDKAVGKKLRWFHDTDETKKVIGVVKNFNFSSLHNAVEPALITRVQGQGGGWLHLKIAGGDLPRTIESIRDTWTKYDIYHPFEYFFLDDRFNEQYKADEIQFKLLSNLAYICIFISLLGLLGLSAFTATQRTKEIGIRKVHGASIPQIIYLLYKDVMVLVVIAAVLVVPIGYYVMSSWLGNFAYQQPINFTIFALVAVLALIFAFLTVGFHSLRTATTNPVESLKYE